MGRVRSKSVKGVVVFFGVFLYEIRGVKKVHHIGVLQKINYGEGVLTPNITTSPRPTFLMEQPSLKFEVFKKFKFYAFQFHSSSLDW